jgi:hypothetical protein
MDFGFRREVRLRLIEDQQLLNAVFLYFSRMDGMLPSTMLPSTISTTLPSTSDP